MTLVALNKRFFWPGYAIGTVGSGIISTVPSATPDAAGEYDGMVFCASEAMTISHVGVYIGAATGSPTVDVRIETVGTDGLPSGTLWDTNTNIVTGALSTGWTLQALTASASITAGQIFSVKFAYDGGTSFALGRLRGFAGSVSSSGIPYRTFNVGTPTLQIFAPDGSPNMIALGSSSTAFYKLDGMMPLTSVAATTYNNTNSEARGARFKVPFPCRVIGSIDWGPAAQGDHDMVLYDDAGSELSSSSTNYDGDQRATTQASALRYFDNPVTLAKDTWYRLAKVPSSTTNCSIVSVTVPSADYLTGTLAGADFHYTARVSGTWTDTATTAQPMLDLVIDQIDDGATAGGGLIRHPGMIGGLNG